MVVVNESRAQAAREARQQRLYTMGNLWIRKEEGVFTEHQSRSAGHSRKRQHVADWVDTTAVPPPAGFTSPPPPPRLNPALEQLSEPRANDQPENINLSAEAYFTPAALRRRATRTGADKGDSEGVRWDSSTFTPPPPLKGIQPIAKPVAPPLAHPLPLETLLPQIHRPSLHFPLLLVTTKVQ